MRDTSAEALHVWREVYVRLSPAKKWQILGESFATARALHAAGFFGRKPEAPEEALHQDWLRKQYRLDWKSAGGQRMNGTGNLSVLREVIGVLERLGIPYALGGSMASSVYGVARFTQDADLLAASFPGQEEAFVRCFGPDYYLSLPAVQQAVRERGSFNLIQTREGFKVDIFVCKDDPFEQGALARRVSLDLGDGPIFLQTPEDVCLFKLRWYRLGNEASEQQWQDLLGVLAGGKEMLDKAYLEQWAEQLGVKDLLARAWGEME